MSEEKYNILLKLPKNIHDILLKYKKESGVNVNNQIYNAIFWWLVSKGLINLKEIRGKK